MSRPFRSVRSRAALGATLVVAVALVAAGAAVLLSLRANLVSQADSSAQSAARERAVNLGTGRTLAELGLGDGEAHPVQVVDARGRLLAASEDLERISGTGVTAVRPVGPVPPPAAGDDDGGDGHGGDDRGGDGSGDDDDDDAAVAAGEIRDGGAYTTGSATVDGESADYRFASTEVETARYGTLTVYAGAPLDAEQEAVSTATTVMLIGLPALLVVVGGVTWLVTRRALRPVEGIRAEMAAITASEDLGRRVPEPGSDDEVARLARTTNETLAALEASVERQRRFVADASHELRSPIASLRTQLEVGAAHPELLDVPGAVADTVRLQQLAADLLLLARLDAGERAGRDPVELASLVRGELAARAARDAVPVVAKFEQGVKVAGSRGQLTRVLGNLLDNAQRHALEKIEVTVAKDGRAAVVRVADDGEGVPETERERIFERFVRLDDARSRDDGGAGLGLAIARDVAQRHGGTLVVRESARGGALFELRLPAL
ncbi:HAMP domain-containing sensor histidine kinase [Streptomyces sp. GC420]|uniref:sensor histidine kinase n=1 Tax=Streptomyces sp. GC420 TaxID=2697568 RepID=UPI001414E5BA|nr:HAMP domain-containing sensor histidine kinase [Streptomyces sp. GC420]NBM17750.1 HAMP domain-containing protein [Streptomyces sp. GC420]